jgi:DNA-binding IclR family transcriptional regulator
LFELLADGRSAPCDVGELAARLGEPPETVHAAATALAVVGLAEISGQTVAAAPPARYFDALWPIAI